MNTNAKLFWVLAVFFVIVDAAYIVWHLAYEASASYATPTGTSGQPVEWAGTVGLGLCAILSGFIAFYLSRAHRSTGGELAEDRLDANIDDGDPELGFYSPWSWWPIAAAAGAALLFLGIAAGIWIAFIGAGLTIVSLVGWVYEYYRGNFAH